MFLTVTLEFSSWGSGKSGEETPLRTNDSWVAESVFPLYQLLQLQYASQPPGHLLEKPHHRGPHTFGTRFYERQFFHSQGVRGWFRDVSSTVMRNSCRHRWSFSHLPDAHLLLCGHRPVPGVRVPLLHHTGVKLNRFQQAWVFLPRLVWCTSFTENFWESSQYSRSSRKIFQR